MIWSRAACIDTRTETKAELALVEGRTTLQGNDQAIKTLTE